jgi:hypothetical protein
LEQEQVVWGKSGGSESRWGRSEFSFWFVATCAAVSAWTASGCGVVDMVEDREQSQIRRENKGRKIGSRFPAINMMFAYNIYHPTHMNMMMF